MKSELDPNQLENYLIKLKKITHFIIYKNNDNIKMLDKMINKVSDGKIDKILKGTGDDEED